jgi:leader peptidase (prepilin peptidase)/N-methyltransferase
MIPLLAVIFFILGLIIGSFLNVVIYRLNTARSLGGRSACMSCRSQLTWYELIPVFSFVGLLGRCRNCKTKISVQYPLVELTSGIIFLALFLRFQDLFFINTVSFSVTFIYYAFMFSLLLVIAVYDLKHKIIPDILSFIFGALAFVGLFFFSHDAFFSSPIFYWHIPTSWNSYREYYRISLFGSYRVAGGWGLVMRSLPWASAGSWACL